MKLVIVESPAKCSKIQHFLGASYRVEASYGHIRDLAKGLEAIRLTASKNQYEPKYAITKHKVVTKLKQLAKKAEEVIIATDLDREGEAIGFHLATVLKVSPSTTKRIVFNQITKEAIQKAIQHPRTLDVQMFNAQQARRVLDRMIGFTLSPVLWKFVASKLSAGRCQSPALKLIHNREIERSAFSLQSRFEICGTFRINDKELQACFAHTEPNAMASRTFLYRGQNAYFETGETRVTSHSNSPPPPFITSSFQQAASNIGISPKQAMSIAQKLYEAGCITYMRTDSVYLSKECQAGCRKVIETRFPGDHKHRVYRGKSKQKTQEAHEAIHPVCMNKTSLPGSWDLRARRIYDLIWKRTLASQMKARKYQKCVLRINMFEEVDGDTVDDTGNVTYEQCKEYATCEIIKTTSPGWKGVYEDTVPSTTLWDTLVSMRENVECSCRGMVSTEKCTQPVSRYTQSQLIKQLEKNNIGRPSTYSSILSSIVEKQYVVICDDPGHEKDSIIHSWTMIDQTPQGVQEDIQSVRVGAEKQRMCITGVGQSIVKFLEQHFPFVMNLSYTSELEDELDKIAVGDVPWKVCVQKTHEAIQNCTLVLNNVCDPKTTKLSSQRRHLGQHPTTGKPVYVFTSRKGTMIQHGEDKHRTTTISKFPGKAPLSSITLNTRLLNHIPRDFGMVEGKPLIVLIGKYGPFVKHGTTNIPLPKGTQLSTVTLRDIRVSMNSHRNKPPSSTLLRTVTKGKSSITIHNGPYGNYIKRGNTLRSVPKGLDVETVTAEQCRDILKQPKKKSRKWKQK